MVIARDNVTLVRIDDGEKGDSGITVSLTAPPDPIVGQLWQTASEQPIKRWNGSSWVLHYISVENLKVEVLSAIAANLGIVTAGIIKNNDDEFPVEFDITNGVLKTTDKYLNELLIRAGCLSFSGKDENTNAVSAFINLCETRYINSNTRRGIQMKFENMPVDYGYEDVLHPDLEVALIEQGNPSAVDKVLMYDTLKKASQLSEYAFRKGYVKSAKRSMTMTTSWVNMGVAMTDITTDNPYMEAVAGNNGGIKIKKSGLYYLCLKHPSFHLGSSVDGSQVGWTGIFKNNANSDDNLLVQTSAYIYWTFAAAMFHPECSTMAYLSEGDIVFGALSKSSVNGYNIYSDGGTTLDVVRMF